MKLNQLYFQWAEETPDKPFLIVDDTELSYRELRQQAMQYAAALHDLDINPGDRVALYMDNRTDIAPLYFACFHVGAVAMPISCFDAPEEVAYAFNDCGGKILIVEPEKEHLIPEIRARAPQCIFLTLNQNDIDDARSLLQEVKHPHTLPPPTDMPMESPAVVMYTSGSTGHPKGVTHSRTSLMANAKNRVETFRHQPAHSFFSSSKLCHAAALTILLLPMASCGGTVVTIRKDSTTTFLHALRHHSPTFATSSPVRLRETLDHPDCRKEDFAGITAFFVGGDKSPESLSSDFLSKTGFPLRQGLGMTELGGYMVGNPYEPPKPGTTGKPIHGTQVRILDANMNQLPPGEYGQVVVKTEAAMIGYWGLPDLTAKAFHDGWMLTGDLGFEDDEGYFTLTGRIKNTIIRNGGNTMPEEVESAMCHHPDIHQCGVTGIPDGIHGQAIVAFIVPENDASFTDAELDTHAREYLAERRCPQHWVTVDALPETEMGKLDRRTLHEQAMNRLQHT